MKKIAFILAVTFCVALLVACSSQSETSIPDDYDWEKYASDFEEALGNVKTTEEKDDVSSLTEQKDAPSVSTTTSAPTTTPVPTTTPAPTATKGNGLSPDFKEAMDSYEKFMDEYVAFMKKYQENPSDLKLLVDYAKFMKEYQECMEDFEKWQDEDMNKAETAYYLDVQTRVNKKLLEIV